ncbi:MAG TPA: MFS transporter [Chthonomonadales bacterium]|nr:MFS transporter [Chthonomonadales bacterium]
MKRSPLVILFVTVVIDLLGFGIILPLLPLYVKQFDGTPVIAGWLATSFSIMQFLFAPIWGRVSDIHGRRPMILMSLLGSAIAFFLFGIASNLWILFVARIAAGILTAASLPTAQAYIADITPPERRARGMAMIGVAFGIGFACGPWIGGALGRYGLAVPAFFVAGMALINFIWSFLALPESLGAVRNNTSTREVVLFDLARFVRAIRSPALGPLLTLFSVATFAFALMEATFTWLVLLRFVEPQHGAALGKAALEAKAAATVGPIFGLVGITAVLAQGAVMGGLAQKLGERTLVRLGALALTLTLFGIGVTTSLGLLTVLAACLAAGNGMLNPSLSSLVSKVADPDERGGVLGLQQGLGSFARIIAPPFGTWLLQSISIGSPYFLSGTLMGIAFVLSLNLGKVAIDEASTTPSTPLGH